MRPADATPIASSRSRSNTTASKWDQHGPSNAIAQTAAVLPNKSAAVGTRSAANQRPVTSNRVARSASAARGRNNSHPSIWQRMNVAMQAPEPMKDEMEQAEDLPLPGHLGQPPAERFDHDPFGEVGGDYYPTCGPEGCGGGPGCGGGCACGDACSCGDACEPGCGCRSGCGDACEPGCGCSSNCGCGPGCGCGCRQGHRCDGECCNDCFCIGPGDPESCHSVRLRVPKWQELHFFAGAHGFKGPYDLERDSGNFGFHEGFNSGFKIPYTYAAYQIGYQATHSQLNGDEENDIEEGHTQHFSTFGLFRRTQDGLQFGTAWDVLVDERWSSRSFHQLRSEMSWVDCGTHELGFSATVGMNEHELEDEEEDEITFRASDQYLIFYRIHGKRGGEGRLYAGWNDDSDGILGSDMMLPVHDRWSVNTGFTYLIPDAKDGEDGASEEAWNIHLALVWHWGCTARKGHCNPYRPLFNVANNGYLIVDGREHEEQTGNNGQPGNGG
jgi:hypothetical protein